MIAANELRIGNWVQGASNDFFKYYQVTKRDFTLPDFMENSSPIPLTPEILGKSGFEIVEAIWIIATHKENKEFVIHNRHSTFRFTPAWCLHYNPIEHLHQLQNLYFALTGEELKVKL